jgi:hypothetical protein
MPGYPIDAMTLELPAGEIPSGASPIEQARQELAEETGIVAHCLDDLGGFAPFAEWAGLERKIWLPGPDSGTYGGVYLVESPAAADESRATELFRNMTASPAFTDLTVREFAVLEAPTAVTSVAPVP